MASVKPNPAPTACSRVAAYAIRLMPVIPATDWQIGHGWQLDTTMAPDGSNVPSRRHAARIDREPKRPVRIYLDSGWPRDNYEVTRDVRNRLHRRGFREGRDLLYFAWPEARHDERAWATRVHVPFQFFFGRVEAAIG